MKAILLFILSASATIMAQAQDRVYITANGVTHSIILTGTEAAVELKNRVTKGDVSVTLNDYGGFEKVGELPWSLPTDNRQVSTEPGDVMLYQGNNIVIFYGTNSWTYTPLGMIEGMTASEIRNFLSGSHIEIKLSADNQSGLSEVNANIVETPEVHALNGATINMRGRTLEDLPSGLYIVDGNKYLK